MYSQRKSPLSTSTFETAERHFYPLIMPPSEKALKLIPKLNESEEFAGIAVLKLEIPSNIFLNTEEGITYFKETKIPMGFSLQKYSQNFSAIDYWNEVCEKRRQTGPLIMSHILPQHNYEQLFNAVLQQKIKAYYHDPATCAKLHHFAVVKTLNRIKTYFLCPLKMSWLRG